jgi:hypothetical protein
METGPEPQELLEQAEHTRHHVEHAGGPAFSFVNRCAITASIMAVLAACGSLLSGHAVNEAIIKQAQATDEWAYYQAKSTKEHVIEGDSIVLSSLLKAEGKNNTTAANKAISDFQKLSVRYGNEKDGIKTQAEKIQQQSEHKFAEHEDFSFAVACFQIAIVLSSISMIVQRKWLYMASLSTGIFGLIFIAMGMLG